MNERKIRADNNNLGKGRGREEKTDKEKERVGHVQGTGSPNLYAIKYEKGGEFLKSQLNHYSSPAISNFGLGLFC
jgi:hypothetical protein